MDFILNPSDNVSFNQDVLKALEGAMVGVDGWANWYYDALNTLESFETKRAACDKLAENDPPNRIDDARIRACRTNINLEYTRELQRLSDDFMKISVGMEDVADRAIRDIRRCIRRLF
jgi:hypothetical protein